MLRFQPRSSCANCAPHRHQRVSLGGDHPGYHARQPELYPAKELASLYQRRWTIETSFRDLKTTMKMEVLKCETVNGVLKELAVFVLIYNLVRLVMLEASRRQNVEVDRISFIDALRWLVSTLPGDALCHLVVNPHRPGRYEPRIPETSRRNYQLMNRPRRDLKKALAT